MQELASGHHYRLPNRYIVTAIWDESRKLWFLRRDGDASLWFVNQAGELESLLFGLVSIGQKDQEMPTGWRVDELEQVDLAPQDILEEEDILEGSESELERQYSPANVKGERTHHKGSGDGRRLLTVAKKGRSAPRVGVENRSSSGC